MKKLLSLLLLATFTVAPAFANERIVAEGSTTVLPVMQRTAEVFMNQNPGVNISIRGGGSGVGINSLIGGRNDIAMSSRAIRDSELRTAAERGVNPRATMVALDAIAVVVNNNNPVNNLTQQQVTDIFTGRITNWSEVGGESRAIVVISRDTASGSFETFNELALRGQRQSRRAMMQASNQSVAQVVSTTPGAIGYVGLGYLDRVKALSIDGIAPTAENVLNGAFPYARPLFVYTNGAPTGAAQRFLNFVQSAAGQRLAASLGYVPFN
ncbi:MAG: phosphate ABC transporter substrate-binding protein [Elusimicrobia bacterium]|nr:phosphate ABC transporter substrate-binding protein [Elusimicrobiota bacterium]